MEQQANLMPPRCQRGGLVLMCVAILFFSGCTRSFWRQQADDRTYDIVAENEVDTRWIVPRHSIEPDVRSRFFDPYDPDEEPLPPDDPVAHDYMHEVAGIKGYKSWHKLGRALSVENPQWLEPFGLSADQLAEMTEADGTLPLDLPGIENLSLEDAIELSLIHSREYQTELENVYLTALTATLERFQFDVRYLGIGGGRPSSTLTHTAVPGGDDSLSWNNRFGISQLLPTGGQWAVELANNTLWFFTGPNRTSSASVLSYSLVQPLLVGASRKIALENLTQAERNVLYALRDLARFRKEFFVDVVSSGPSGGFLGLLLQQQGIVNQRDNVRRLERQVEALRVISAQRPETIEEPLDALPPNIDFPESVAGQIRYDAEQKELVWQGNMSEEQAEVLRGLSDDIDYRAAVTELVQRLRTEVVTLDVAQLESRLARSRNALRSDERRLADSLDRFKIQLGLPPNMPLTIDNEVLDAFQLIDPKLLLAEQAAIDFVEEWARLDEDDPQVENLRRVGQGLQRLQQQIERDGFEIIEDDVRRVDENLPRRLSRLDTEAAREQVINDVERDRRLLANVRSDFETIRENSKRIMAGLEAPELAPRQRTEYRRQLGQIREQLLKVIQSLQVVQIGERVELITLQAFELSIDEAVRLGLENRLDLMNARGALMDARRQIEIDANQLESVLDIVVEGDVRSSGGPQPFDFRGDNSSFRAGVEFTAPLDQIAERNRYRASLVAYQRARRDFMATEDNVKVGIRDQWRRLRNLEANFEVARQAIRLAATQFDLAVEESTAPVDPTRQRQAGSQGLNLINALDSVLEAQDGLISIWVDYERSRLNIYRDMGIMEIDENGFWVDEFYQPANAGDSSLPPEPMELDGVESENLDVNGSGHGQHADSDRAVGNGNSAGRVSARRDGVVVEPASHTKPSAASEPSDVGSEDRGRRGRRWRRTRARVLSVRGRG